MTDEVVEEHEVVDQHEIVDEPPPRPARLLDRIGKEEARKDRLSRESIVGEVAALFVLSFLLWFFIAHKLQDTGFYTDEFGSLEMFMMYFAGGFAVSIVILRLIIRRRNLLRPLDGVNLLFLSAAHAVLLASFPFDFEHVDAVLPGFLKWMVTWMTDWIGAAVLALGLVGGLIGAAVTFIIYFAVKKELSRAASEVHELQVGE